MCPKALQRFRAHLTSHFAQQNISHAAGVYHIAQRYITKRPFQTAAQRYISSKKTLIAPQSESFVTIGQ
jgi:hypothetical protein